MVSRIVGSSSTWSQLCPPDTTAFTLELRVHANVDPPIADRVLPILVHCDQ
jgi:hypothetical protein